MTQQYELTVVDGLKTGACAPIISGARHTIGDQVDCDIVLGRFAALLGLSDGDGEPTSATLHHDSTTGVFSLLVESGLIQLDGSTLQKGATVDIALGAEVQIAGSTFVLSLNKQTGISPSQRVDDQPNRAAESPNIKATPIKPHQRLKPSVYKFGVAALLCLSIASGLTIWVDGKYIGITAHDRASSLLQQIMQRPEYSQIELQQSGKSAIKVVGYIQQRTDLQKLRKLLSGMEQTVFVEVSVGEIMAESVASVFRVNDLDAKASSMASGEVLVQTSANDLQLLKKVETIAYADVAGLESLKIENTPPPVVEVEDEPVDNDFESVPGKRIVMVMATEPTYILTEDGSRYFTGSILPSGHKVKAILEQKVELELDQNTIEVVF